MSTICKYLSMEKVEQWAYVWWLGDGDDMHASSLNFTSEDWWDSTFIQVSALISH
jgi:hypothetical protein